jgi:hypothetical protein
MTSTGKSATRDLQWRYPESGGSSFVLQDRGTEIGWLQFHEEPTPSTGEFEGKRWMFRYSHTLQPRITVYAEGSPEPVAEYLPSLTGGGVVTFASGVEYRWRRSKLWSDRWCFSLPHQRSSICVSQEAGPLTKGGQVAVCCGAADLAETPVLLLLAWFLRVLEFEMLVGGIFRAG